MNTPPIHFIEDCPHAHQHTNEFARAAVHRTLRKDLGRAAVVLSVSTRAGGGYDYGLQPLSFTPCARMLVTLLDELPFGSTISLHVRQGLPKSSSPFRTPIPPKHATLRLVR